MKLVTENIRVCDKCGNVMVNRILRRDSNGDPSKLEKILQCIVCRHWILHG
ncbi:MAG: hypothetical protein ACXABG_01710 [Promethearchaeota archaeon]|jgi:hypothetical protein